MYLYNNIVYTYIILLQHTPTGLYININIYINIEWTDGGKSKLRARLPWTGTVAEMTDRYRANKGLLLFSYKHAFIYVSRSPFIFLLSLSFSLSLSSVEI